MNYEGSPEKAASWSVGVIPASANLQGNHSPVGSQHFAREIMDFFLASLHPSSHVAMAPVGRYLEDQLPLEGTICLSGC